MGSEGEGRVENQHVGYRACNDAITKDHPLRRDRLRRANR